jgi:hypothetical protein
MNFVLPDRLSSVGLSSPGLSSVVLRRVPPALCLFALTAILTGCGPENGEQVFPFVHNASLGGGGQLVTQPSIDFHHRNRTTHFNPPHRHIAHL